MAQKLAQKANLTIYSANGLKAYVDSLYPKRSAFVPNGVDFDFFNSKDIPATRHPILKCIPDPVLLYIGMIDPRIDFSLIRNAANKTPTVSFVFTGPHTPTRYNNNLPDNVYFSGPVPHDELPWLMKSVKAGIIPFNIQKNPDLICGIRPLKLFEYMAAGLPVICARWSEIEKLKSPAWLYDSEQEFVALIKKVINQKYTDPSNMTFSSGYDWSNSFKRIMTELSK